MSHPVYSGLTCLDFINAGIGQTRRDQLWSEYIVRGARKHFLRGHPQYCDPAKMDEDALSPCSTNTMINAKRAASF